MIGGVAEGDRVIAATSLQRWLLWSSPPLSGRRRFVFYAGSLALFAFLNDGFAFTLGDASPYLYEPRGMTAWLGIPYLRPTAMRALMAAVYLAWLCAAVGLFTRAAKVATAIGVFVAVGFEQAYVIGSNHTHYLLLYSLVCLSFSTSDGDWSVDAWLRNRSGSPDRRGPRPDGLGATGLPLQILLILTVSSYFSAGVSKLVDGGIPWTDGTSLQYYIGTQIDGTSFAFVSAVRSWVAGELWATRLFSVATLVLELGAPLALISRPLRHLFIPAWVAMHMGILVLMRPNYWIHCWCLLVLLVDWPWLRTLWMRWRGRGGGTTAEAPVNGATAAMRGAWIAAVLVAPVALAPPLLQIEWYPLTHVPMYGTWVAPGMVGGIPEEDFGVASRVREIARRCAGPRTIGYTRRCPWRVPRHLGDRLVLELHGAGRRPAVWDGRVDRLRFPLIQLLATAPSGSAAPGDSAEASELAARVRNLLASEPPASLEGYDSFLLQYRLNDGVMRLVAGPLRVPD